jgi:hypothetical protein
VCDDVAFNAAATLSASFAMRETTLKPGFRVSTHNFNLRFNLSQTSAFCATANVHLQIDCAVTYSKTLPNTLANCDEVPVSSTRRGLLTLPPFDPLSLAGLLLTSFLLNTFPTA